MPASSTDLLLERLRRDEGTSPKEVSFACVLCRYGGGGEGEGEGGREEGEGAERGWGRGEKERRVAELRVLV